MLINWAIRASVLAIAISLIAIAVSVNTADKKQPQGRDWRTECTFAMGQKISGPDEGFVPPFRELCKQMFGLDLPKSELDARLYRMDWQSAPDIPMDERKAWLRYLKEHPEIKITPASRQ